MSAILEQVMSLSKGSIEMPAGTGKTQQIVYCVKALVENGERVLILTHTNAGVSALIERFKKLGVATSSCWIGTICSFAEKIVLSYPKTSGFDLAHERGASVYYNACVSTVLKVLRLPFCRSLISRSFDALIVDEYQDCDMAKHEMLVELSRHVSKSFVFGDRLQRIYDFDREPFPDWSERVELDFPPLEKGDIRPRRWEGRNEKLGDWLLNEVRPHLITGGGIAEIMNSECVDLIQVEAKDKEAVLTRQCFNLLKRGGSSLVLGNSWARNRRIAIARKLKGHFCLIEDVEGKDLKAEMDSYLKRSSESQHALWLALFAKKCFSGLGEKFLNRPVIGALERQTSLERYFRTRKEFCIALKCLQGYMENPSSSTFRCACSAIEKSPVAHLYLKEEWRDVTQAVHASMESGLDPLEVLYELRSAARFRGERVGNHVGSTLLVKGLEYDNVLLSDLGAFRNSNDLYVALTRPRDFLQIISIN